VHDNFWGEAKEDELEQADSKSEASPIMPVLHHFQAVSIELDLTSKVHLMKSLHGNLVLPTVLLLMLLALECEVVFNWAAWVSSFLVLARGEHRGESPKGKKNGYGGEEGEEDSSL